MSDKLKTIPDIIAYHRQRAKEILGNGVYEDILEKEEAEDAALDHEEEADRIESAYKREIGNAQMMREALANIVLTTLKVGMSMRGDVACGIIASRAKAALAASPRNCDVGTEYEQAKRFYSVCKKYKLPDDACEASCPMQMSLNCELAWAQMPYEKEEAK